MGKPNNLEQYTIYKNSNVNDLCCFILACAAWSFDAPLCERCLEYHGLELGVTATCRYGLFIEERRRSRAELNSTVCDLPRWAKRQGY